MQNLQTMVVRFAAIAGLLGAHVATAAPAKADNVALGKKVYESHCAACHGMNLEGQPNWRTRRPDGKLPAPPHDATGHTWEHSDAILFSVVKNGMAHHAGAKYRSDMPAFKGKLTDAEIWAAIAYIKSKWPERIQKKRQTDPLKK